MLGLFKPKLPIDADEFEWTLACFRWFVDEFGAARLHPGALILPDAATFPLRHAAGHDRALELFGQVKRLAGMADWDCDLIEGERAREARVGTGLGLHHVGKPPPAGTFGFANGRYFISYNPARLDTPESLIAVFAHELGHYLLHTARTPPPGGRDLEEHATDLAAVYLGFGLFMANAAKSFRRFQTFDEMGWERHLQGYLNEATLVTATAMFARLAGADARGAEKALKDYLRKPWRKALAVIDRTHPDPAAMLAAIDLAAWQDAG